MSTTAIRAAAVTFRADPFLHEPADCLVYEPDAVIAMDDGKIADFGPADEVLKRLPADTLVLHYPDAIVSAGFIDTHIHYPQTQMVAAFGEQLLEWLTKYTFIAEQQFADIGHARSVAGVFLRELLRAGTTTAAVYCTVHPQSVDAFFEESSRFNTRMIAGKVLMDRNAPPALLDTAETGYRESQALIGRWHGRGRQHYCITPRFAPTSTDAQLDVCGTLRKEYPDAYVQTHLCENLDEIAWVRSLFPARQSYLDVYAHAGIVGDRSIYGHGIHLTEQDFAICHQTGAALAHCPTSNLFLGSGLFDFARADAARVPLSLATDVGGGTSFSMLQTMNELYKVARMGGTYLPAQRMFYLATLGGARALQLEGTIGSFTPGCDADFIVLDPQATPLLARRSATTESLEEQLFALAILGDDRAIAATYSAGVRVHQR